MIRIFGPPPVDDLPPKLPKPDPDYEPYGDD